MFRILRPVDSFFSFLFVCFFASCPFSSLFGEAVGEGDCDGDGEGSAFAGVGLATALALAAGAGPRERNDRNAAATTISSATTTATRTHGFLLCRNPPCSRFKATLTREKSLVTGGAGWVTVI